MMFVKMQTMNAKFAKKIFQVNIILKTEGINLLSFYMSCKIQGMIDCVKIFGKGYDSLSKEDKNTYHRMYYKINKEKLKKKLEDRLNKKTPNKKCKKCGKKFFSYNNISKYCSKKCFYEVAKIERLGIGNPAYRNGNYTKNNKIKYDWRETNIIKQEISIEMEKTNGHIFCKNCGKSNSLKWELHHIVFRSEAPKHKNLNHKKNLIFLGIGCHNIFHKDKPYREKIIKERKLWELFPDLPQITKYKD